MIISETHNMPFQQFTANIPDNHFDLLISDPPYGIGFSAYQRGSSGDKVKERYTSKGKKDWDKGIPTDEDFRELFRVSKNQIIWGGNYFPFLTGEEPPNLKTRAQFEDYMANSLSNWLYWHKGNPVPNFADGELAWHSGEGNHVFKMNYWGNVGSESDRIHPTQKPRELYDHCFKFAAEQGWDIRIAFDSHLGSGSSRDAANIHGIHFYATEKDPDIFKLQEERFARRLNDRGLFL